MDKCCMQSGITNGRQNAHHVAGDAINKAILRANFGQHGAKGQTKGPEAPRRTWPMLGRRMLLTLEKRSRPAMPLIRTSLIARAHACAANREMIRSLTVAGAKEMRADRFAPIRPPSEQVRPIYRYCRR
jgi:hypothetical protein